MTLKEMLYRRLAEDDELAQLLAKYQSHSAVFYQQAPASQDAGWGEAQYPRVDYTIDTMGDPARNVSQMLILNIWCDTQAGGEPEPIERRIHELLHSAFAQPDDDAPHCFAWTRTDAFEGARGEGFNPNTYGVTMRFDILAFPILEISSPDPMGALAKWTKRAVPHAHVIGVDEIAEWLVPGAEHPVIYWRLTSRQNGQHFHFGMWFDVQITGHVIATEEAGRAAVVDALGIQIPIAKFAMMENRSPFHFATLRAAYGADYLRTGQMVLSGRYVIQPANNDPLINHIYFNGRRVPTYG